MTRRRTFQPTLLAVALGVLVHQAPAFAQDAQSAPPPATTATPAPATPAAPATPEAAPDPTATELDAVTVTGFRYAIEASLEQKRNANAIVEVITAEDVSKFPDKNVADALQRVPGVIIERSGGEGKSVSVRGLQPGLTLTQLNGNYVASSETNSEASRSFNYTLMPANLLSSAELFKSPEARLDEGGIGGTVILHTRRPLDLPANTGFASVEGTQSDTSDGIDPQVSGMYSWQSKDERFGVLVGVTHQERTNRSMEVGTESWQWYGDADSPPTDVNGNPFTSDRSRFYGNSGFYDQTPGYTSQGNYYTDFFMPTAVNFSVRDEQRERQGAQLTFQFKPAEDITFTANYFRFELQGDYTLNSLKVPEWNIARFNGDGNWDWGRLVNGVSFDRSGSIVTGMEYEKLAGKVYPCSDAEAVAMGLQPGGWGPDDCTVPTPQLTGTYSREEALSQTADLQVEWNSDTLRASFKGGRTWSEGGPSMNFGMAAKPRRRLADGSWQAGNTYTAWDLAGTPTLTVAPNLQEQLMAGIAEVDTGSTGSSWIETSIEQEYVQADFTKLFETGWVESLQFGAKFSGSEVNRNTGNSYWVCQGADPTDYSQRYQAGCDPDAGVARPEFFLQNPIGDINGGFDANVFPGIDFPAYIDYLNGRYGQMQNRREPDFIYNVEEDVTAGYLQANFRTERLRGNVGLRVVETKQKASSTDAVERFNDYFLDGPDGNPLPCTAGPVPAGMTCESGFVRLPDASVRDKTFALNTYEKTYTDVLPSFNIAWDMAENWVLRGAASKVISRAAYTNVAFPGAFNFYTAEYSNDRRFAGGAPEPGWYGSGSNRDLEPFEATQYDIGVEWYFQPGAVLGLGLFRKDIKNFVIPVVQDATLVVDGEQVLVNDFSTQANGRDGVSQGAELYAQYTFDFGFGVQANYTYNDTNFAAVTVGDEEIGESPLVGSAKNQGNVTMFYETPKFLARVSYNRRGDLVGGIISGFNVYSEPYEQVDLNLGYNFTPELTLTGSVLNATRSEQRTYLGNDTKDRFNSNVYSGRIYYMGLTYKF